MLYLDENRQKTFHSIIRFNYSITLNIDILQKIQTKLNSLGIMIWKFNNFALCVIFNFSEVTMRYVKDVNSNKN